MTKRAKIRPIGMAAAAVDGVSGIIVMGLDPIIRMRRRHIRMADPAEIDVMALPANRFLDEALARMHSPPVDGMRHLQSMALGAFVDRMAAAAGGRRVHMNLGKVGRRGSRLSPDVVDMTQGTFGGSLLFVMTNRTLIHRRSFGVDGCLPVSDRAMAIGAFIPFVQEFLVAYPDRISVHGLSLDLFMTSQTGSVRNVSPDRELENVRKIGQRPPAHPGFLQSKTADSRLLMTADTADVFVIGCFPAFLLPLHDMA